MRNRRIIHRRARAVRGLAVAAVVLLGLIAAGCNLGERVSERVAETAIEKVAGAAAGGDVDIDTSDGSMRVETDEGTMEFSGDGGSVPDGFPDEFPLPDDLAIDYSTSMTTDDGLMVSLVGSSGQTFDTVAAWFTSELPAEGWSIDGQNEMTMGDIRAQTFEISGHGLAGAVSVHLGDEDGDSRTGIQLNLHTEEEGQ